MRKSTTAFALICTIAVGAFLGACSKNCDKCSGDGACCKDKDSASMKTDAQATPAAGSKCSGSGSCSGKCTAGDKKTCPVTGQTAQ